MKFLTDIDDLQPRRATTGSAGYDFFAPQRIVIQPHKTEKFGTGVRVTGMAADEVLKLYIRSSLGLKYQLSLPNSVAVIDSDYTDEIQAAIRNDSDFPYVIEQGERYMQGVFQKYLTTDDDKPVSDSRHGGIGSTGK